MKKSIKEIWKQIDGYDGIYEISSLGRLKVLKREVNHSRNPNFKVVRKEKIASLQKDKNGYLNIILTKDKKQKKFSVSRLVSKAFIPNPENKPHVNHKKGIKTDNRATELEWCTNLENQHHSWNKLGRKSSNKGKFGKKNHGSIKIVQLTFGGKIIKIWDCINDAERYGGFNHGTISACCRGKFKQHKGFKWKYFKNKKNK